MLQLTSREAWCPWLARWRQLALILLMTVMASGLTACGNADLPSQSIIEQAIARQIERVQQPLSQQLKLTPPTPKDIHITHLKISERETVTLNGEMGYHIRGYHDLTLRRSGGSTTQTGYPFDVYLQPRQDGKATRWQLAQKQGTGWILDPLNGDP